MTIVDIREYVESLGGVLTLAPAEGDGTPELAWGDLFFYYAPDGQVPNGQPFATVVTKDYPGEPSSGLGGGVFRVNVDASRRDQEATEDATRQDEVLPHPVYADQGWVCVVAPEQAPVRELIAEAHAAAERRWVRRRS